MAASPPGPTSDTCHLDGIYQVYTKPFFRFIPGIYLVYTFQLELCAPPGSRIAIEMQQHTGIGLQACLMFCGMWRRHWVSVSQDQAVARPRSRRQSRAAYDLRCPFTSIFQVHSIYQVYIIIINFLGFPDEIIRYSSCKIFRFKIKRPLQTNLEENTSKSYLGSS